MPVLVVNMCYLVFAGLAAGRTAAAPFNAANATTTGADFAFVARAQRTLHILVKKLYVCVAPALHRNIPCCQ